MPTNRRPRITGRQTLWIPASAMWACATNGAGSIVATESGTSGTANIQGLPFSKSSNIDKNAQFDIAFPKGWDEGNVSAIFHWTALNAETGTKSVVWGLQGFAIGDGSSINSTYGTLITVQDVFISAKTEHISGESGAIALSGLGEDKRSLFRVVRQASATASDTLVQDALLLGIRLFYNINSAIDS